METKVIDIGIDFGRYPAGRFLNDGPYSGQAFREKHLVPALESGNDNVIVKFDSARGLASSFLEEAFGGLVRVAGFDKEEVLKRFTFESNDTSLIQEVRDYITKAMPSKRAT